MGCRSLASRIKTSALVLQQLNVTSGTLFSTSGAGKGKKEEQVQSVKRKRLEQERDDGDGQGRRVEDGQVLSWSLLCVAR